MTEAQIKAFLVIAEKGSIAHAAESMFVSLPLSANIYRLWKKSWV